MTTEKRTPVSHLMLQVSPGDRATYIPIDSITLTEQVGTAASASFSMHTHTTEDASSSDIDISSMNERVQMLQQVTTSPRGEPNMRIVANDGDSGSVIFDGFLTRPGITLQSGNISMTGGALHPIVGLSGIDMYPYKDASNWVGNDAFPELQKIQGTDHTTSIATRVLKFLEYYRSNVRSPQSIQDRVLIPAMLRSIEINNDLFPLLEDFLRASEETSHVPGLDLTGGTTSSNAVNNDLDHMLFSSHNINIFNALVTQVTSKYMLEFVAPIGGQARLIQLNPVRDADEVLQVPVGSVSSHLTGAGQMAVSQVFLRSALSSSNPFLEDAYGGNSVASSGIAAVYPDTAVGEGKVQSIDCPEWVQGLTPMIPITEVGESGKADNYARTVEAIVEARNNMLKAAQGADQKIMRFFREWARMSFLDMLLSPTSAYGVIPLNFNVQAGKVYEVISSKGTPLFTGYLTNVTHSIKVAQNSGSATTSITFSHVRAPGFEMPA